MRGGREDAVLMEDTVVIQIESQDGAVGRLDDDGLELPERLERFGNGEGGGEVRHPVSMAGRLDGGKSGASAVQPMASDQVCSGQSLAPMESAG